METKKKGGFSGALGFVMAAAGSAVGVGNIWRFPYLAAKDGGGLFIIVYIALVITFGFTLLVTDISIGRKTKQNALRAFGTISPKWNFLGKLTFLVPAIIMTYYGVIGGWVTKYIFVYALGRGNEASQDGFFTSFITNRTSPIVFLLIFLAITALVVYFGVEKGVERFSKAVMPILLVMIIAIAGYSLTLSYTTADGTVRTGIQGLGVYLIPNLEGITFGRFLQIVLDAMSQLFFSLSVSMGIMITYGSYVNKDVDLNKSITNIEIFDTFVALVAGAMIIPAVYVFSGTEGMSAGPSLMFISLPKVFEAMGTVGAVIGLGFFVMVAFAALTSCVSIMETLVANCMEIFGITRKKASISIAFYAIVTSIIISLGYNIFYFEFTLPTGSVAQLLDIMDYISNSFLMPLISMLTCILIGWVVKPQWINEEMEYGGRHFGRKKLYAIMVKYVAPVIMAVLFIQSTGITNYFKF